MDLESSLEESLDPDNGSSESLERKALQKTSDEDFSDDDAGAEATTEERPKNLEELLGGSLSGGGLQPVLEEPSESADCSEPGDVDSRAVSKEHIEPLEAPASVERRLSETVVKGMEEDLAKKRAALEAENKTKLERHRKEMKEEFDMERDKIFAELQAKHDKEMRDEKQRLKEEFASKKSTLREEASQEAEAQATLEKKLSDSVAECEKLRMDVQDLQQRAQDATSMSANALVERERLQSEFERSQQQTSEELEGLEVS
jgi:hypothetical protein